MMPESEKDWDFRIQLQVRDYELDAQGIVNNAVYMNYMEHCRHNFLRALGIDFAELHREGVDPVVVRSEIDFLRSLRSNEEFEVFLKMHVKGRAKYEFEQIILVLPDRVPSARGRFSVASLVNGRPGHAAVLVEALEAWRKAQPKA